MLELASVGAKVLQTRSVGLAMKEGVRVQVLSSFVDDDATPADEYPGTMIVSEEEMNELVEKGEMERQHVTGIAHDKNEAKIILTRVPDKPGAVAHIFDPLAKAAINVDMIISHIAKISVVGVGMKSHAGVAATMFRSLADRGINIQAITTSEIKVSVMIDEDETELAVRVLHTAYGLDAPDNPAD